MTPAEHRLLMLLNPTVYHDGKCSLRYSEAAEGKQLDVTQLSEVAKLLKVIRSEGLAE